MLAEAAVQAIGILGKTVALPIPDDGNAEGPNKKIIVDTLFSILNNAKANPKMKEKAALSLGQLCLGENFPHDKFIAEKLLAFAKEVSLVP